jgi:predicted enzyme related to lactoylglutathione lyase
VHDLGPAVSFYEHTLGLPRSLYIPERSYAEFETGNLTLSVVDAEAMGLEHRPQQTVALHVDDVQTARRALEGKGVQFKGETIDTGVCHMAIFSDPDGNDLMLHSRYAPREVEAAR